ncbi:hypothetical protein DL767_001231 [Monosporascus sp. MG133]|nr:hypothetical protein DL767_001231 [Monosporascus sp. MG133]
MGSTARHRTNPVRADFDVLPLTPRAGREGLHGAYMCVRVVPAYLGGPGVLPRRDSRLHSRHATRDAALLYTYFVIDEALLPGDIGARGIRFRHDHEPDDPVASGDHQRRQQGIPRPALLGPGFEGPRRYPQNGRMADQNEEAARSETEFYVPESPASLGQLPVMGRKLAAIYLVYSHMPSLVTLSNEHTADIERAQTGCLSDWTAKVAHIEARLAGNGVSRDEDNLTALQNLTAPSQLHPRAPRAPARQAGGV